MSRGLVTSNAIQGSPENYPLNFTKPCCLFFILQSRGRRDGIHKEQSKGLVTYNWNSWITWPLLRTRWFQHGGGKNLIPPLCFYFTGDAGFYGGKQRGLFSFWSLWTACNTSKVKYAICSFRGQKVQENAKFTPYCSGDEYLNNSGAQVLWVGKQM